MERLKIGVGLWCVSFASDRFVGRGYRPLPSVEEQINMVGKIKGAESIDLHTSDFEEISVKEIAKIAQDNDLKINAVNPNVFGDPIFKYGAFSNTDEVIRRKAIDLVKKSVDMAQELDANISSLWPGQDGFDYYFQNNYYDLFENTVNALQEVCDHAPQFKFGYEFKPKEPRMYSLIRGTGEALNLIREVNRKNLGIVFDYGHSIFAGENPSLSLSFLEKAGKLFNIHFNDAYGSWDDDLMAGSVDVWRNLEFLLYLKESSYDGYVTLDMFPFREDPFEACSLAVRMMKTMEGIVDHFDRQKLKAFQERNDAVGVMEYLRMRVLER